MGACSILKAVLGPEKLSSIPPSGPLSIRGPATLLTGRLRHTEFFNLGPGPESCMEIFPDF